MHKPLDGIKVLDMTRVLAGPYCTMMLGDMGADVVKIERPEAGDDTRGYGPPFANGEGPYFMLINGSKPSLTLNLKHPWARKPSQLPLDQTDGLVENVRPRPDD